jgi:hypothetical protein
MTLAGKQKRSKTGREVYLTPAMLPALSDRKMFANFWSLAPKQMQFVLHFTAGAFRGNMTASYHAAGYRAAGRSANGCASILRHNPKVAAAIKELMSAAGLTPDFISEKILQQTAGVDAADIQPFLDGDKTLAELRDDGVNTAALDEVQITHDAKGNIIRRAKAANPIQLLRLAADVAGMVRQQKTVTHLHRLDLANCSPEQLKRIAHATRPIAGELNAARDAEFSLVPAGDDRQRAGVDAGGDDGHREDGDAVAGAVGVGQE